MLAAAAAAAVVLRRRRPAPAGRGDARRARCSRRSRVAHAAPATQLPGGRRCSRAARVAGDRRARVLACARAPPAGAVGLLALGALPFRVPVSLGGDDGEPAAAAVRRDRGRRARLGVALAARRRRAGRARRRRARPSARAAQCRSRSPACRRALRAAGALLDRPRAWRSRTSACSTCRSPCCSGCCSTSTGAPCGCATRSGSSPGSRSCSPPSASYEYATGHLLLTNAKVQEAERPQALLPGQLAVLRPEHLRALPGADDDRCSPPSLLWTRRPRDGVADRAPRSACCGRGWCSRCRSRASPRCCVGLAVLGRAALEAAGRCSARSPSLAGVAVARRAARPGLAGDRDRARRPRWTRRRAAASTSSAARCRMARDRPLWGFGSGRLRRALPRARARALRAAWRRSRTRSR